MRPPAYRRPLNLARIAAPFNRRNFAEAICCAQLMRHTVSIKPQWTIRHPDGSALVPRLLDLLLQAQVPVDLKYVASQEAVVALHGGECDVSGFPVPVGEFEQPVVEHYRRWLDPREMVLIHLATRRQGLMLAPGNPKRVYGV